MISIHSFVEELVKIAEETETEKRRIFDNSPMGRIATTSAIAGGIGAVVGGIATKSAKGALRTGLETGGIGMLASTMSEMSDHIMGKKRTQHQLQPYLDHPKEKIALTLGDVQLIKKQPETTYGKFREGVVGAAKGALTGAGVATLLGRNPRMGAGIGAGAYLLDRNMYGEGEKLASFDKNDYRASGAGALAGGTLGAALTWNSHPGLHAAGVLGGSYIGAGLGVAAKRLLEDKEKQASVIPTSPLAFTPARARAARQATSAMQNFTQPRHVGLTPIGGRTGQLRTGAGPKISPPNPGSPV